MKWMWIALAIYLVIARYCDFKEAIGFECHHKCASIFSMAAHAQEAPPHNIEVMKVDILRRAYHMNGDSMVRMGSIDMSQLPYPFTAIEDPKHPFPSIITVDKPKPKRKKRK